MLRYLSIVAAMVLLCLLGACSDPKEYRLTPEQLAWQGYQAGEVIHFGRARDGQVRTYKVTDIKDELRTQHVGITLGKPPKFQEISVSVQRIDTIAPVHQVLKFSLYNAELRATAAWDELYPFWLPIDSVSRNAPIDTTQYSNTKLLRNIVLGPTMYPEVLHVTRKSAANPTRQNQLYYAKGQGVVAYEEDDTGLWYRLP